MKRKLGCALSHARAWAAIRNGPALVLEDDAVVAADLLRKVAAILEFIEERHSRWHLVYFYSPCPHPDPSGAPVVPYSEDYEGHHGNVGYLMSPEGRRTLLPLIKERVAALDRTELAKSPAEPHFALDHSIMEWVRQGEVRVFWATEHLVETIGQVGPQRQADDLHSNIIH